MSKLDKMNLKMSGGKKSLIIRNKEIIFRIHSGNNNITFKKKRLVARVGQVSQVSQVNLVVLIIRQLVKIHLLITI